MVSMQDLGTAEDCLLLGYSITLLSPLHLLARQVQLQAGHPPCIQARLLVRIQAIRLLLFQVQQILRVLQK